MECGLAASPGIAIGKTFVYSNGINFSDGFIEIEEGDLELERFNQGVASAKEEILLFLSNCESIDDTQGKIMKAHSQIIDDPVIKKMVTDKINNNRMNAQTALKYTIKHLEEVFSKMNTEYMQQRAVDIKDVGSRITKKLLGMKDENLQVKDKYVIVARDLMPSDILRFDKTSILGFITEVGGVTSHVAIIARSAGIPAVLGVNNACSIINSGDDVVVDGSAGNVFIRPNKDVIDEFSKKRDVFIERIEANKKNKDVPAVTKDGKRIILGANIGSVDDIALALDNGAEKIGLFRTEFIYMEKNELPSEEEQYGIYKAVIQGMKGKPVVIRTLDVGGDKNIPYLRIQKEDNPFLGLRGIRYCLKNRDIFGAQLRAILRASGTNEVIILLPMVSCVEEVVKTKEFIRQVKQELETRGVTVGESVKIGTMIEVPSSALIVEELAAVVDYFSIGTNDLCQYVLAIDRTNKQLDDIYNPIHPAILRLIRMVAEGAHSKGKKVGVCGEMAGNTEYTELLIDAGVDELSMNALSIPEVKKNINILK